MNADRRVVITFCTTDLKPGPAAEQTAIIWADAKSGRVKLATETKDGALVSTEALPAGDGYNVMVQLKTKPDANAQNFKVKYIAGICGGCQRPEYACTCDHAEAGHDHKN